MHYLFILLLTTALLTSCSGHSKAPVNKPAVSAAADSINGSDPYVFPYDLKKPSEKFKLPDVLVEISGIDVFGKSKLVCVQDEKGKVYVFDIKKGELKDDIDFGSKGDYEGVANVNDTIWVLSSDGNLHRITQFKTKNQKTEEYKTPLNKDNDTEGLCYDAMNRRLLIACKDKPGASMKGMRSVYAFDLKTNTIATNPVYLVKIDAIKQWLLQNDKQKFMTNELRSLLDPKKGDVTFQPSEIHIHPLTQQIYLLSSVGKLLLVLNRDNSIQYVTNLDPDIFKQPEGITFLKDGTMYISDEGRDGKGNILKFNYQPDGQ